MKKIILILMLTLWGCGSLSINPDRTSRAPEWWEDGSSNNSVFYGYGREGEWGERNLQENRMSAIVEALTDIVQEFDILENTLDIEDKIFGEDGVIQGGSEKLLHTSSSGKFSLSYDFTRAMNNIEVQGVIEKLSLKTLNAGFTYNSYKGCEIEYKKVEEERESEEGEISNSEYRQHQLIHILDNNGSVAMELIVSCQNEECATNIHNATEPEFDDQVLIKQVCSIESFIEDLKNEGFTIKEEYLNGVHFVRLEIDKKYFDIENLKGD